MIKFIRFLSRTWAASLNWALITRFPLRFGEGVTVGAEDGWEKGWGSGAGREVWEEEKGCAWFWSKELCWFGNEGLRPVGFGGYGLGLGGAGWSRDVEFERGEGVQRADNQDS